MECDEQPTLTYNLISGCSSVWLRTRDLGCQTIPYNGNIILRRGKNGGDLVLLLVGTVLTH